LEIPLDAAVEAPVEPSPLDWAEAGVAGIMAPPVAPEPLARDWPAAAPVLIVLAPTPLVPVVVDVEPHGEPAPD
jgi:hypothetical protein